jgi:hypothetical protein
MGPEEFAALPEMLFQIIDSAVYRHRGLPDRHPNLICRVESIRGCFH